MWHLYAFMHQRNTLQTTTCKFIEIQKAPLHVLDADVYVQIYLISSHIGLRNDLKNQGKWKKKH